MKRGRSIQAGQKDLAVQAPPGGLVDPLVQESQVVQDCQVDSPLKVLRVQEGLLDLGFRRLDFLFLLWYQSDLVLLGSRARLHFLGSLVNLEVLVHQGLQESPVSQAPQEALGWSGLMRTGWEYG